MTIHLAFTPILAIAAGIVVLVVPRFLNYAVAFFLIAFGVLKLLGIN